MIDADVPFIDLAQSPTRRAGAVQTLTILGVFYPFHWIPAGKFTMGRHKKEFERAEDETLHETILTRGFWMLEFPVTQRMRRSVMNGNPSWFSAKRVGYSCDAHAIDPLGPTSAIGALCAEEVGVTTLVCAARAPVLQFARR